MLALVFPAWFYLSSGLNRELLREGEPPSTLYVALALALPLYAVILGFPLIAAWYLKLDFRRTFRWRAPSVRSTAAALCLGGATWILAAQFFAWQRLIWPEAGGEELRKLSEMLQRFPDALALFVMALTPALCEEHFFRGFLLSGLRQAGGKWQAILAVGLIFGAFHIPMIRMPVTALLGILMAWLTWESRSLWPAALLHLLHNVCSVIFGERLMSDDLAAPQGSFLDLKFLLPAVVFFVAGLWLARNSGREEPASPPEREPLAGQAD
ncbi:MAG: CPBP family intramembrane metalloprotease [Planctomycetota bacterium]|nr:CPBP family intramembrane metalloprotease [Planctomycetota bacterium]